MFIIGCLLVGIGIGMVTGNAGAGALIGLGVGFVAEALVHKGYPWGRRRSQDQ